MKKYFVKKFPRLASAYRELFGTNVTKNVNKSKRPHSKNKGSSDTSYSFKGWGMTTTNTNPPWVNSFDEFKLDVVDGFTLAASDLNRLVKEEKFIISHYEGRDQISKLGQLRWRHYIIYWSALYAARNTNGDTKNIVECGVCDGFGVFFAMRALKYHGFEFTSYLYDAWEGMKEDYLLEGEMSNIGKYASLQLDNAKRNLSEFSEDAIFNKGFVPDSFQISQNPDQVSWLHIDLNSAIATDECLKYFYEKVMSGGVILFDDYGFRRYVDTKKTVDAFFYNKENVQLLHMPTGQAIVFKK